MRFQVIMATVMVGALGLAGCSDSPYSLTSEENNNATLNARDYADKSNGEWAFGSCSGVDSPPINYYVSCPMRSLKANVPSKEIECAYKNRSGCREKVKSTALRHRLPSHFNPFGKRYA